MIPGSRGRITSFHEDITSTGAIKHHCGQHHHREERGGHVEAAHHLLIQHKKLFENDV